MEANGIMQEGFLEIFHYKANICFVKLHEWFRFMQIYHLLRFSTTQ